MIEEFITSKKAEVAARKGVTPLEVVQAKAILARPRRPFSTAVRKAEERHGNVVPLIAETKFGTPTSDRRYLTDQQFLPMARLFDANGAAAVCVLADAKFFGGGVSKVEAVANDPFVRVPVIYKDFCVADYQIWEARATGADAVLAICGAGNTYLLPGLVLAAQQAGIDVVFEVFDETGAKAAVDAGAAYVGVNNRNLEKLEVDFSRAERLRRHIPDSVVTISESGIDHHRDVLRLVQMGYDGVLVGTSLVRSVDPAAKLRELCGLSGPHGEGGTL